MPALDTKTLAHKANVTLCIRRGYACFLGGALREAATEIDRLRDALNGLVDWCEEGSPDGGRFALIEAKKLLANITLVDTDRIGPC